MCRTYQEFRDWNDERIRQEEEDRYWAEREAYAQYCEEEALRYYEEQENYYRQYCEEEALRYYEEQENYYRWMPLLFWYDAGFYEFECPPEEK